MKFDELRLANKGEENRGLFSIAKFAIKYNLDKSITGNLYQVQIDDYVLELC